MQYLEQLILIWEKHNLWIEFALVSFFFLVGNIYLGHFEERLPKWRKLVKFFLTLIIIIFLSLFFSRTIAFVALGLTLVPIIYVHGFVLPKKGINGLTGEPKSKYYEWRGWDKNADKD